MVQLSFMVLITDVTDLVGKTQKGWKDAANVALHEAVKTVRA